MVDAGSDELLGMHIVSHLAGDLLPQGMAMLHTSDWSIRPLVNALVTHPTLSEGVKAAVTSLRHAEGVAIPAGI